MTRKSERGSGFGAGEAAAALGIHHVNYGKKSENILHGQKLVTALIEYYERKEKQFGPRFAKSAAENAGSLHKEGKVNLLTDTDEVIADAIDRHCDSERSSSFAVREDKKHPNNFGRE